MPASGSELQQTFEVHPIFTVAPLCGSRANRVLGGLNAHVARKV